MINPYSLYAICFSVALVAYSLPWSSKYPPLSFTLLCFLIVTIIIHILLSVWASKKQFMTFVKIRTQPEQHAIVITAVIYIFWLMDFVHAEGIPLVMVLLKQPYDYRLFGIPTLHVLIATFSSFYCVFLFHQYLSSSKKSFLILTAVNMFAAILIYNRGMLVFTAVSCFVLIAMAKPFRKVYIPIMLAVLMMGSYLFGVLGNLRVVRESRRPYSNELFLGIGEATPAFISSGIPGEFFWVYMYITSPLANLQTNVANKDVVPRVEAFLPWVTNEVCMDFISKRINAINDWNPAVEKKIDGPFNVSTVYGASFSYLGWFTVGLMALIVMVFPLIVQFIIRPSSRMYLTAMSILSSMFLLLAFTNSLKFTGFAFQLFYPVVWSIVEKLRSAKDMRASFH